MQYFCYSPLQKRFQRSKLQFLFFDRPQQHWEYLFSLCTFLFQRLLCDIYSLQDWTPNFFIGKQTKCKRSIIITFVIAQVYVLEASAWARVLLVDRVHSPGKSRLFSTCRDERELLFQLSVYRVKPPVHVLRQEPNNKNELE